MQIAQVTLKPCEMANRGILLKRKQTITHKASGQVIKIKQELFKHMEL